MTDEIELLRHFREAVPPPSARAWARAREAIAAVAAEADKPLGARSEPDLEPGTSRPPRSLRRRQSARSKLAAAVVALAGAAALVALLLTLTLGGASGITKPVHTPWQAARALPARDPLAHVRTPAGSWRLASYITQQGWQRDMAAPEPGYLTCPTALVCYVTGDNAPTSSGPALFNPLYVTSDGAQSWSALPVPSGVEFTTPLTCPSAGSCAAGATYNGQGVLITTTDGAHSFSIDPLPSTVGLLYSLTCPSSSFCAGLGATSAGANSAPVNATLVSTGDWGSSFSDSTFRAGESMLALACPTTSECVAVGYEDSLANDWTDGIAAVSRDGGATWTAGTLPAGFGINYLSKISCPNAQSCFVLGDIAVTVQNPPQCAQGSPAQPPASSATTTMSPSTTPAAAVTTLAAPAVRTISQAASAAASAADDKAGFGFTCYGSAPGRATTKVSDVAASSDGGLTWAPEPLPASAPLPVFFDIACTGAQNCVVSGTAVIRQSFGQNHSNGGSAVVLQTDDGGSSWSTVTFAVPSTVPSGVQSAAYMAVGDVQCPQAGVCIGLGVNQQGSDTTPVYTSGSQVQGSSGDGAAQ